MSKGKYKRKREHRQSATPQQTPETRLLEPKQQANNPSNAQSTRQGEKELPMGLREAAKRSSFTDWCLMIFTGVLAVVAIYQFVIMGGQLDTMRKDQRAWVSISASDPQIARDPASGNATITWPLVLANTGKTLARHASVEIVVDTVRNGEAPTFAYDKGITWQTTAVVFPNAPVPIIGKMLHTTKIKNHPEEMILTRAEYQDLLDGTQYIVVYAKSSYLDIFKKEHCHHFCGFKSLSPKPTDIGGARSCTNYNDVDDN
jgi:hypothetical protein